MCFFFSLSLDQFLIEVLTTPHVRELRKKKALLYRTIRAVSSIGILLVTCVLGVRARFNPPHTLPILNPSILSPKMGFQIVKGLMFRVG